jgi:hypothetical protein
MIQPNWLWTAGVFSLAAICWQAGLLSLLPSASYSGQPSAAKPIFKQVPVQIVQGKYLLINCSS